MYEVVEIIETDRCEIKLVNPNKPSDTFSIMMDKDEFGYEDIYVGLRLFTWDWLRIISRLRKAVDKND